MPATEDRKWRRAIEVAMVLGKLGVIGFGGPAAHIAMMQREVVERRRWLEPQHFLDLIGATNLIPGPNSTQIAIHLGLIRAGWMGLIAAGVCFILPAFAITTALTWAYVEYGALPQVDPWLAGVRPAVLALVGAAVWKLGRNAVSSVLLGTIGVLVAVATLWGINEVLALLGGGLFGMVTIRLLKGKEKAALMVPFTMPGKSFWPALATPMAGAAAATSFTVWKMALFFLKVGCTLYGSGYLLVAFLEDELVKKWQWLTPSELLDAVAIGQLTPGPILTTASSVGYIKSGLSGAAVATAAIFLPSFIFVALLKVVLPILRQSPWTGAFLDAVNVSAVALMAVVCGRLAIETIGFGGALNWPALLILPVVVLATLRWKAGTVWIVLCSAFVGRLMLLFSSAG